MNSPISKSNSEGHKHTSSLPTSISANVENSPQIKSIKNLITLSSNAEAFYNIVDTSFTIKLAKNAEAFIQINAVKKND